MRMLAVLAVVSAALSLAGDANAQSKYWPWCARYDSWTIVCSFETYQQCAATVSGVGGYCQRNVMPPPGPEARPPRRQRGDR
jgi:hypothetical protein